MESFETFIQTTPIEQWGLAFLSAIAAIFAFLVARSVIVRRVAAFARETHTDWDNFMADLLGQTRQWFLVVAAFFVGSLVLGLPPEIGRYVNHVSIIALCFQSGIWGHAAIRFGVVNYKKDNLDEDANSVTVVAALGFIGTLALWIVILLLILDNVGVEVTSLVAGLGITGIAVALAVQNILGDLLASLTIILDRPFVIGDFIKVGDSGGIIEKIGLKTTRLRTLYGEQLIFANSDLIKSRINNFQDLRERRISFSFRVHYNTPSEKVAAIPNIIQEVIEAQPQVKFDRAHFKGFDDFGLNYEVVYYMLTPDYRLFMDVQQAINLGILRHFEETGIAFAYLTQVAGGVPTASA